VLIAGIDPGITGAVALWDDSVQALKVWDMPILKVRGKSILNEPELVQVLTAMTNPDHVYVEQVHAMPKQGTVSMFSFGMSYGIVKGILAALDLPTTYVTPQSWQKRMQVPKGGKDASRSRALQLLPRYAQLFSRVRDNGRSDAALIALFGACQQAS
jgi:crossover junction endodeoxyribonuclease RuvC